MTINDGGPAFPHSVNTRYSTGAATDQTIQAAAEWPYKIADAMLAARAKPQGVE